MQYTDQEKATNA